MIELKVIEGHLVTIVADPDFTDPDHYLMHVGVRYNEGAAGLVDPYLHSRGFKYLGKRTGEHAHGKIDHDYEVWARLV